MYQIFQSMCGKNGYTLDERAGTYAKEFLEEMYENRDENFGNARDVRNFFERAVSRQSDRVAGLEAPDRAALMALDEADLKAAAGEEPAAEECPETEVERSADDKGREG